MDALKDIGAFLATERKRQQISLEELSRHTRISVRMLQAVESGEYEIIGTPLLIRGFLKVYCQALGVDPQPILEEYETEIRRYDNEGERLKRFQSWMKGAPKKGGAFLVFFLVLAFGVTVAGVWAVWWPKYQMKRAAMTQTSRESVYPQQELPGDLVVKKGEDEPNTGSTGEEVAQPPVLPVGETPTAVMESGASSSSSLPPEGSPETPPATTHTLHIVADEESWIQVQVDDAKPQNRILKPGESAQWSLSRSVQLWTGNAGGIRVSWDGKPMKPLGKRGEVLRVKLPDPRYFENP